MGKICAKCKVEKPLNEFYSYIRSGSQNKSYKSYCIKCYSDYQKETYIKNKKKNYPKKINNTIKFVYILYNKANEIIYVGKTSCIESRLRNHITKSKFHNEVYSIKFCICNSQAHCDIREIYYINLYKPKYNTVSKYDEDILDIVLPDKVFYKIAISNFNNIDKLIAKYTKMHYENECKDKLQIRTNNSVRKDSKPVYKLDPVTYEILDYYPSCQQAELCNGISVSNVSKACKGKQKTAGGFKWCYSDSIELLSL